MVWQLVDTGKWYYSFEGGALVFDTQQEALTAMALATEVTIEKDMLEKILTMLPQLKAFYAAMNDMTADWYVNQMPEKVAEGMQKGTPLADFSPAFFAAMGVGFEALAKAMKEPIPLPPEVLAALGIKEFTLEYAIRNKWHSIAFGEPLVPAATFKPILQTR